MQIMNRQHFKYIVGREEKNRKNKNEENITERLEKKT